MSRREFVHLFGDAKGDLKDASSSDGSSFIKWRAARSGFPRNWTLPQWHTLGDVRQLRYGLLLRQRKELLKIRPFLPQSADLDLFDLMVAKGAGHFARNLSR